MGGESEANRLTITAIKSGGRNVETIEWPGKSGVKVGLLCPLTCEELQESYFAARERFKRQNREVDWAAAEALEQEEMLQQCYRMLIDPTAKNPEYRLCKSADEARKLLEPEERAHFCDEYRRLRGEVDWLKLSTEGDGE